MIGFMFGIFCGILIGVLIMSMIHIHHCSDCMGQYLDRQVEFMSNGKGE